MKPLLRAVLVVDALLLLAFGVLFLLTPWTALYNALRLVQTGPVLVGQAFGVALIGLAWLALHASIHGGLTAVVAKVVGHVNWLTGLLTLVWLVGLHTPSLTGFGQLVAVLTSVVLVVTGLGGVRLSGAVQRRERARVAGAISAERAESKAAIVRDAERRAPASRAGVAPFAVPPAPVPPVEPGYAASDTPAVAQPAPAPPLSTHDEVARDAAAGTPGTPGPPFHG
jgi:hypothetical protein